MRIKVVCGKWLFKYAWLLQIEAITSINRDLFQKIFTIKKSYFTVRFSRKSMKMQLSFSVYRIFKLLRTLCCITLIFNKRSRKNEQIAYQNRFLTLYKQKIWRERQTGSWNFFCNLHFLYTVLLFGSDRHLQVTSNKTSSLTTSVVLRNTTNLFANQLPYFRNNRLLFKSPFTISLNAVQNLQSTIWTMCVQLPSS